MECCNLKISHLLFIGVDSSNCNRMKASCSAASSASMTLLLSRNLSTRMSAASPASCAISCSYRSLATSSDRINTRAWRSPAVLRHHHDRTSLSCSPSSPASSSSSSAGATWVAPSSSSRQGDAVADDNETVVSQIWASQAVASSRVHRFYTTDRLVSSPSPSAAMSSHTYLIEGEEARHALRSLRLSEADEVELCDGAGGTVRCVISALDRRGGRAWMVPVAAPVFEEWRGPVWVLAVGCLTLKGGRSEWLVEKATELGAREFIPVATERSPMASVSSKFRTSNGKAGKEAGGGQRGSDSSEGGDVYQAGRLERVALSATKQSLRAHNLVLRPPTPFQELLEEVRGAKVALLAAAGAPPAHLVLQKSLAERSCSAAGTTASGRPALHEDNAGSESLLPSAPPMCAGELSQGSHEPGSGGGGEETAAADALMGDGLGGSSPCFIPSYHGPRLLLLVGPEGDFTPREVELLVQAGALPVGLGVNRLRTETAAIALLSMCSLLA